MKKSVVYSLFSKIPTLKTARLTLRKMKPSDYLDMYEYASDERVTRYLLWKPHDKPATTRDYLRYIQTRYHTGDFYDWAVIDNESKRMIGTCGFTRLDFDNNLAEIGYVLNPTFWGKGIAVEAAMAVIEFAFMTLNVRRVEAKYIIGNGASRRVMEKCGMTFEGVHRQSMYIKGEYKDIGMCSIISDEYMRNR